MTSQSGEVRREDVHRVIVGHLTRRGISESRIVATASWSHDLGIDSLDTLTLIQELEDTFGVRISEHDALGIQTVGGAIDFVVARASGATTTTPRGTA